MLPTPFRLQDSLYRIYFSGRNDDNQSHIGWFDLDLSSSPTVVAQADHPVLSPGPLGCFDDNGVSPSCVVRLPNGSLGLYYVGWNPGSTVRMHLYGGLATSSNEGRSFERWSRAPILERTQTDPYLNTAPWVVAHTDGLRMYYVSGVDWVHRDLPRYNVKVAYSQDGFTWRRPGDVVLDFESAAETALARPYVVRMGDRLAMWFSTKGDDYRIAYAESDSGLRWERGDNRLGLSPEPDDIGTRMVEYGVVISGKSGTWMLYNGDNYGEAGIGIARWLG